MVGEHGRTLVACGAYAILKQGQVVIGQGGVGSRNLVLGQVQHLTRSHVISRLHGPPPVTTRDLKLDRAL